MRFIIVVAEARRVDAAGSERIAVGPLLSVSVDHVEVHAVREIRVSGGVFELVKPLQAVVSEVFGKAHLRVFEDVFASDGGGVPAVDRVGEFVRVDHRRRDRRVVRDVAGHRGGGRLLGYLGGLFGGRNGAASSGVAGGENGQAEENRRQKDYNCSTQCDFHLKTTLSLNISVKFSIWEGGCQEAERGLSDAGHLFRT